MGVRILLNSRIDLNSLKIPPASPYTRGTPTDESASTPELSPTSSSSDLFESPCPMPPPMTPSLPSFALPPIIQTEDLCSTVKTTDGREINADLVVSPSLTSGTSRLSRSPQLFCTGQTHNTSFLEALSPNSINYRNGSAVYVMPSLQLGIKAENGKVRLSDHPNIFVIGDAADAFGAQKSGNAAWGQASGLSHASGDLLAYVPLLGGACC